ncbi:MAG: AEC family transporter [Hyphomicrobiaceae bacterium]
MISILTIIAPVFGIIAIGYFSGRTGYLSEAAARGIGDFAFNITIPALLFRTIVLAKFGEVAPLGILASFFGAAALVWALSAVATRFVLRRPATDGPSIAMCAVFGNTIMLGLPIGVATFGNDALAPLAVILAVHAPVFLLSATLHTAAVEAREGQSLWTALVGVGHSLLRQPIIVAIVGASVWRLIGADVPGPVMAMLEMLAKAGVPAALIALGLSLRRFEVRGNVATLSVMLVLKMMALPLIAAAMAYKVFHLPDISAKMVVLTAALPAGANSYLFALRSGRAVNSASGAVAIGTAISAISLTLLLIVLHQS